MPTRVSLILRKENQRADGLRPVFVQLIAGRKKAYLSTGIFLLPKDWSFERRRVKPGHDLAPRLNAILHDQKTKAEGFALDGLTPVEVKGHMLGPSGSLDAYFDRFIDDLEKAGRFWDWKKYRVLQGKLRKCFGDEIDWNTLDSKAPKTFENHLRDCEGNSSNTIGKEMQRLRRVIRQAMKDGEVKKLEDPFVLYEYPRAKKTNRRKLSMEEILRIQALDFEWGSGVRVARDVFLFSFYGGGVRFGDLCCLRSTSIYDGKLKYQMLKTGSVVNIPLPAIAMDILKKYTKSDATYLFPLLVEGDEGDPIHLRRRISSHNVIVNLNLKKVAELAGIPKDGFSMHIARHSYADFARTKGGNLYAISKTLGHSDLQTTELYLKSLDQEAVDKLAEQVWGS
ncbi:MAG: site-specific integrase [Bacteroidetes bacterium]|nr:site-specific integrase [Bacteroidota bacterium]